MDADFVPDPIDTAKNGGQSPGLQRALRDAYPAGDCLGCGRPHFTAKTGHRFVVADGHPGVVDCSTCDAWIGRAPGQTRHFCPDCKVIVDTFSGEGISPITADQALAGHRKVCPGA